MLSIVAENGAAGSFASLPDEVLRKLNIRGNGYFRLNQDGRSASVRWIAQDRHGIVSPVEEHRLGDTAAPTADEGMPGEAPGVPRHPTWVAEGTAGETAGRPTGPVQFVRKLMEAWRLDGPDAVRLLGFDPEDVDYVAAVLDGRRPLRGRDVRDRVAHLFCIRRTLWSLFRNPDAENGWLRERHSMLNGASPLSLMLGGSMEDLLLVREYVESAAGVR